jgi:hypothetical protein
MNREVHVRFWESPEVKVLRATRQERRFRDDWIMRIFRPVNLRYRTLRASGRRGKPDF